MVLIKVNFISQAHKNAKLKGCFISFLTCSFIFLEKSSGLAATFSAGSGCVSAVCGAGAIFNGNSKG